MNNIREKLELHCDVISGYAFKTTDWKAIGIPVIKIGNISDGENVIIDNKTQYVDYEFFYILNEKYRAEKGDILISLTGSHINQPNSMVGRCCRNFNEEKYLINQRAAKVIPFDNTDKNYLYYLLSTKAVKYYIANRAYGGANQVNISPRDIKNIKWEFPDLLTQQRIADILSAYDDLIENNNKRITLLEKVAQELYKEWFVRFRFPGYENTKFVNGLPEGWGVKPLGDICKIKSGYAFKSEWWTDEGVSVIKIKDIQNNTVNLTDLSMVSNEHAQIAKQFEAESGDLLIAMTGATIGKLAIVPKSDRTMFINQRVGKFFFDTNKKGIENVGYVYCLMKQKWIQELILMISGSNAAQPNISPFDLEKIKIIYNENIIDDFNRTVHSNIKLILKLQQQNQNLIKQRDLLLPRLMSGKLEV